MAAKRRASYAPNQLSLDFGEDPPGPDIVYFAVRPDEAIAVRITRLARDVRDQHGLGGALIPQERLHVSLNGVGGYDEQVVAKAQEAAAVVAMRPFRVMFNRMVSFKGAAKSPLTLCADEESAADLAALRQGIGSAMARAGLRHEGGALFTPHVTLLYDRATIPEAAMSPIVWTVSEFTLIHSLRGQGRHIELGRWPLLG